MAEDFNFWFNRRKDDSRMDWRNGESNWVEGYIKSVNHPHRKLIIDALKTFKWNNLLELGCNAGPNLSLIQQEFPRKALFGIDASPEAILSVKINAIVGVGNINDLPYPNKYFDIVLADAVLMYISDKEIYQVMQEIDRVTRKGVILVEWDGASIDGKIKNFHWARNYKKLLEKYGFKVEKRKLTKDDWPNEKWIKNGCIYIARRA